MTGVFALALLAAAAGLAFSLSDHGVAWRAYAAMVALSMLSAFIPIAKSLETAVGYGLILSITATAFIPLYLRRMPASLALVAGANAGLWLGLSGSISSTRGALGMALPLGLLFLPGRWINSRGYGMVLKVFSSWIIAIAALALLQFLLFGQEVGRDHME